MYYCLRQTAREIIIEYFDEFQLVSDQRMKPLKYCQYAQPAW